MISTPKMMKGVALYFLVQTIMQIVFPMSGAAVSLGPAPTMQDRYPVYWSNLDNAVVNIADNTVSKVKASSSADAGAISANRLLPGTDGWVEFAPNPLDADNYQIGLTRVNAVPSYTTIDYCFQVKYEVVNIRERGTIRATFNYKAGDVFRIVREGNLIKYYVGGVIMRTVSTSTTYELHADCSITSGTTTVATTSFNYSPRTLYAIADGTWNSLTTWSLTEGGVAGQLIPLYGDVVYVKGYAVRVSNSVICEALHIHVTNGSTAIVVNGSTAILTVAEAVKVRGEGNADVSRALQVMNYGKINVALQ